jgi:chromosome segregation ATPase
VVTLEARVNAQTNEIETDSLRTKSTTQKLRQRAEDAEKDNLRLKQLNSRLELSLQQLSASHSGSESQASALEEARIRWQAEISKRDDSILLLEREIQNLEFELEKVNNHMALQQDALYSSKTQLEDHVRQVGILTQELSKQESEVKLLQRRLNDAAVSI